MEISKSKIKAIARLRDRKQRKAQGLFAVEGHKSVVDTLPHFELEMLVATAAWLSRYPDAAPTERTLTAKSADMKQMSALSTPPDVIAVYRLPEEHIPTAEELRGCITLLLDGVQDPGNLGTIVRSADWFGVRNIVASPGTVDILNPKAIQSTMGAQSPVNVCYAPLPEFIAANRGIPLYGTLLEGESIYEATLPAEALIVMGNEGKGLSPEVRGLLTDSLFIPPFPADAETVDSLNVAMATAVVLAEFRRPNG